MIDIKKTDTLRVIDNTIFSSDLTISVEARIYFLGMPKLFGFYISLLSLQRFNYLKNCTQQEIQEALNLTDEMYKQLRDSLVVHKVIELQEHKKYNQKEIIFNAFKRLSEADIKRLEKVVGGKHQLRVMKELQKKVSAISTEDLVVIKKQQEQKQEQLFIENKVQEEVKKIEMKKKEKEKAEQIKFPNADYRSVLDWYKKYKGIGFIPNSPEEARYKKAIKNMFLSGHKIFDIIECMKFFNTYHNREGYEWMTQWTIETIGKKMAEYKAGKLKLPDMTDGMRMIE